MGRNHGKIVRRAEQGDLLFLDDFLKQGRATFEHLTAAVVRVRFEVCREIVRAHNVCVLRPAYTQRLLGYLIRTHTQGALIGM